jgi:acetolactate synthase-1/2/3 large subunit
MFDQAGMVREAVKWDYELRTPNQAAQMVDRALALAMSEPRGPVYVTLPREILAQPVSLEAPDLAAVRAASPPAPDAEALEQLADWLSQAENPLIVASSYGRRPEDVDVLSALAENWTIPVVAHRQRYVGLPNNHAMHAGYEPAGPISQADLIMVVDSDVPWLPKLHKVNPEAKVVHIGPDPLFGAYVMRNFPCHLAISGYSPHVLAALGKTLERRSPGPGQEARRMRLAEQRAAAVEAGKSMVEAARGNSLSTQAWVAACLNEVRKSDDILITETAFPLQLIDLEKTGTHFGVSPAGGLGWSLGEALGLKLALPERRIVTVVGDGGYMFGNPTPAHYISEALGLPTLTIILNNGMWGAVRRATLSMYPEGAASRSNDAPLTHLKPSPRFEHVVEASGGYAERVETAADLPAALKRASKAVDEEGRQAVLNVICEYSDGAAIQDARR